MNATAEHLAAAGFALAGLFADPLADRIAGFIRGVGLTIEAATLDEPTVLPGMTVRFGHLLVDEARLAYPGDLLHEAGHLAILEPATRMARESVGDNPAEEVTALAWSYAAARALDLDPALVFHADGYRGGSAALLTAFTDGATLGSPMLEYYGMTRAPRPRAGDDGETFPKMRRWVR